MGTDKQKQASRANGALSKGPITRQGKANSSRNATRHGLLSRTVVLEEEDEDRFLGLLESLTAEFEPRSATEIYLVETMAVARWRQLRTWGLQKTALDRDIAIQDPETGPASVRAALALKTSTDPLLRYEIAF